MKINKVREMRSEYTRDELGRGVRGKYFDAFRKRTNLVLLSADVAKYFSSDEAVNDALRSLITISEKTAGNMKSRARRRRRRHED